MIVSGSGKNRSRREKILWETEQRASTAKMAGMGLVKEIPVRFLVDRDSGQPNDAEKDRDYADWILAVSVPVRGSKNPLKMEFAVPVFDCGETLEPATELNSAEKAAKSELKRDALAEAGGHREMIAGGGSMVVPSTHGKATHLWFDLVCGIFWWSRLVGGCFADPVGFRWICPVTRPVYSRHPLAPQ